MGYIYRKINYIKRFWLFRPCSFLLGKAHITQGLKMIGHHIDRPFINLLLKSKNKRVILFNPGPVMTTATVKSALIQNDVCHRDVDFEIIMQELTSNAIRVFDADEEYSVVFISGSGTSGLEAAISSAIPEDKKILILNNGAFGTRLCEIADLHHIKTVVIKKEWGELFDLAEVEEALRNDPDIFALAVNHHETSVGVLNPVHELGLLTKKYGKLLIVDAVSSLGGETISVRDDNVDICITSANKCLHAFAGVCLICVKNHVWEQIRDIPPRSYYLDLKKYHKYNATLHQTPYTPSVNLFIALNQALKELLQEGRDARVRKYKTLNTILRTELEKLGFTFFTNTGHESHTILTTKPPKGFTYETLNKKLKAKGFLIYPCKPPLEKEYIQIANMGNLNKAMIYDFIFTLKNILSHRK